MSWVRLDDAFYRNDKQLAMSDAAFRLFVCALSFCMTEKDPIGFLSTPKAEALRRYLGKRRAVVKELVAMHLWEEVPAGFLVHDFDEFVDKGSRDRVRKARELKRAATPAVTGNGSVTPLARARTPVPVPEPVPVKRVSLVSNADTHTREAEAICQAFEGLGGLITPLVFQDAEGLVSEFRVPTADEFIAAIQQGTNGKAIKSLTYFRQRFRELNDSLRDAGRKPRDHDHGSRVDGLAPVGAAQ